jgi:hypothetical protein
MKENRTKEIVIYSIVVILFILLFFFFKRAERKETTNERLDPKSTRQGYVHLKKKALHHPDWTSQGRPIWIDTFHTS